MGNTYFSAATNASHLKKFQDSVIMSLKNRITE
jgi:hypothetical protein